MEAEKIIMHLYKKGYEYILITTEQAFERHNDLRADGWWDVGKVDLCEFVLKNYATLKQIGKARYFCQQWGEGLMTDQRAMEKISEILNPPQIKNL